MREAEPAEGLAEHVPALHTELFADRFGIGDDLVGTKLGQRGGVDKLRRGAVNAGGAAGAALVEQHHPVVLQGRVDPLEALARARETGSTLQI